MKCKVVQPDLHTGLLYYSVCCWRRHNSISGWKSHWDTLQDCPCPALLRRKTVGSSSPLSSPHSAAFVPRTRHTCHLENCPLGYRIRAQMLRDFLLFATKAASVTMEGRHSQKRTKKRESIVNDEFIFTICHTWL